MSLKEQQQDLPGGSGSSGPTETIATAESSSSSLCPSPFHFLLEAAQGLHALSSGTNHNATTTTTNASSSSATELPTASAKVANHHETDNPLVETSQRARTVSSTTASSSSCSEEEEEEEDGPLSAPADGGNLKKRKLPTTSGAESAMASLCDASSMLLDGEEEETTKASTKQRKRQKRAPKHDEKWMQRYNELVEYHQQNGNCLVPQKEPETKALGSWVMNQRKQFRLFREGRTSSMTQERIDLLSVLNFEFDPHGSLWMTRYNELQEYKNEFGDCMVPYKHETNTKLGLWVDKQRRQYRCFKKGQQSFMTQERVDLLNKLDFCWEPLETNQRGTAEALSEYYAKLPATEDQGSSSAAPPSNAAASEDEPALSSSPSPQDQSSWIRLYGELEKFHAANGDCMVMANDSQNRELSDWVNEQRNQYRRFKEKKDSLLTPERITLLEKLEIDWLPHESNWENRYSELKLYHEKVGHASLPKTFPENPKLLQWVNEQRSQYKRFKKNNPSTMTPARIAKLEAIGFDWAPVKAQGSAFESLWNTRYTQLLEFKDKHGHASVPSPYEANMELSRWCDTQRQQWRLHRKGQPTNITAERIGLLDAIGFVFEPLKAAFVDWTNQLVEYRIRFGHCNVPREYEANQPLAEFVENLRQQYRLYKEGRQTTLTPEQMRKLHEIGFDFELDPQDVAWMNRLEELREHVKLHGYGSIPTEEENEGLFQWVTAQRTLYQKTRDASTPTNGDDERDVQDENDHRQRQTTLLTPARIAMLDVLGFPWMATGGSPQHPHNNHHDDYPSYHHPHHGWPHKPVAVPPHPMHSNHVHPHHPPHPWDYHYHQYHPSSASQHHHAPPPHYHQHGASAPSWEHYHPVPTQPHYY